MEINMSEAAAQGMAALWPPACPGCGAKNGELHGFGCGYILGTPGLANLGVGSWNIPQGCPAPMGTGALAQGLPTEAGERKNLPICTGVLDYFPLALAEVARVSKKGNDQHNPGQPLHWAKEKSTDHADALVRHLLERGKVDSDGMLHSAKIAWRSLALLETELEAMRDSSKQGS